MSRLLCRVCLSGDLKMHSITDDNLLQIFAKLASCELNSDDGMPTTVCYICVSQLRRCRRFFDMVNESTRALTHLLHNGIEISMNKFTSLTRSTTNELTVKALPPISLEDNSDLDSSTADVKHKLVVKEEPTENEDLTKTKEIIVNINVNNTYKANVKQEKVIVKKEPAEIEDPVSEEEQVVKKEASDDGYFIEIDVDKPVNVTDSSHTEPEDIGNLVCDVCNKLCTSKTELIMHLKIHTDRYSCQKCDKSFDHAVTLRHHMLTHSGKKPYSCNICNKTFTRTDHLKRHMLIHTGKKPFVCEVCKKAFVQAGDLKRHMLVHSGEKQYSCKLCCKTFKFADHSSQHMRTHTGEKPYVCMYCDMAFSVAGNLRRHIQTQHSDG